MPDSSEDINGLFCRLKMARLEVKTLSEKIVDRNLGLVVWALDKCQIGENIRDEARSAAHKALLDCIRGFDPDRGFKFGSYAGRSLLRAIGTVVTTESRRRSRCRELTDNDRDTMRSVLPQPTQLDQLLPDLVEVLDQCPTLEPDDRRLLELVYVRREKPSTILKLLKLKNRAEYDAALGAALAKVKEFIWPSSTG